MELDEFITTTLKSIIKSVIDTMEFAESNGAIINPVIMEHVSDHDQTTSIWRKDGQDGRRHITDVDFDIAVTASNEENSKIGGGLKIQVLNLGASTSENLSNETMSRIKFSLKFALPHQGDE